ncbi:MAG: hypothetical protein ACYSTG_07745 [Planctomycetota bacterium]
MKRETILATVGENTIITGLRKRGRVGMLPRREEICLQMGQTNSLGSTEKYDTMN